MKPVITIEMRNVIGRLIAQARSKPDDSPMKAVAQPTRLKVFLEALAAGKSPLWRPSKPTTPI